MESPVEVVDMELSKPQHIWPPTTSNTHLSMNNGYTPHDATNMQSTIFTLVYMQIYHVIQ